MKPSTIRYRDQSGNPAVVLHEALRLHQSGHDDQARTLCRGLLAKRPNHADAFAMLAAIAYRQTDWKEAARLYARAVACAPENIRHLSNLSLALKAGGRLREAISTLDRLLALRPDDTAAHLKRGDILFSLREFDEALSSYQRIPPEAREGAMAASGRGNVFRKREQHARALDAYADALGLDGDLLSAYRGIGMVLQAQGRYEVARETFERALHRDPDSSALLYNLARAQESLGLWPDAMASLKRAFDLQSAVVEQHPQDSVALGLLGQINLARGDPQGAVASHRRAAALDPENGTRRWDLALALLLAGEYEEGWRAYADRWDCADLLIRRRQFEQPVWDGRESLQGKTLLVWGEQGFGDALQFSRFARLATERGAKVLLEVFQPLVPLFDGVPWAHQVLASGAPLPAFDLHCPLMTLPLHFGTTLASIPAESGLPAIPEQEVRRWQERLGPRRGLRVGIAWSGRPTHQLDGTRSIGLQRFLQGFPDSVQLVSLQREVRSADAPTLAARPDILHFGEELATFRDTGALASAVDVVVCVDTSVAHLAASLRRPTWVLLSFSPDWRWLLDREDSPWYPSARLFRQYAPGDWECVLQRVRTELISLAH
jgi:tetratricopeptide (TPR) repeat protein